MTQKNRLYKDGVKHSERFYEITKTPKSITERFPLHAGTTVLHQSKIILGNFVVTLEKFLQPDSFRLLYTGSFHSIFMIISDLLLLLKYSRHRLFLRFVHKTN